MREEKETIRWTLKVDDAEFSIFDIEGGKFNLSTCKEGWVLGTYESPDDAAAALSGFDNEAKVGHLLKGRAIPYVLSAWTPEPMVRN
jgi:hypothetical protein